MVYNRFFARIIFRIILIFITGFGFLRVIDEPNFLYVKILLVILTIAQIIFLLNYINKINRKLSLFFESVKTDDYNVIFDDDKSSGEFSELNIQLDKLSRHFKEIILKREEQDEYFKAVIEHVGIGIFAFD